MSAQRHSPWTSGLCPACGSYKVFQPDEAPRDERECADCGWYGTMSQCLYPGWHGEYDDDGNYRRSL